MTSEGSAPAGHLQPKAAVEQADQILNAKGAYPCGGDLDGQRIAVEFATDGADCRHISIVELKAGVEGAHAFHKQAHTRPGQGFAGTQARLFVRHLQRRQVVHPFAFGAQRFAAGGQHVALWGAAQQGFHGVGGGRQHVFAVIQHQQQTAVGQGRRDAVERVIADRLDAQGAGEYAGHPLPAGGGRQVHKAGVQRERTGQLAGHRQGDGGFADAARAGEGDEALAEQLVGKAGDQRVAADHFAGQPRQREFLGPGIGDRQGFFAGGLHGDWCHKAIASARHGDDITEVAIVAQCPAQGDDLRTQVAFLDDHLGPCVGDQLGFFQ